MLEQFIYDDILGSAVSNLTRQASFAAQPDFVLPLNLFTSVVQSAEGGENYGSWTRGWLQPPQTGHYTFWLAADDSAELWISTNAATFPDYAMLIPVASVHAPTARGEFDRYLTQKSAALWLERGKEYVFLIYHKQGDGDGFFQAGWQLPDGAIQRPMHLQHVQPFVPQAYSGNGVYALATKTPEIHAFFSGTRLEVVHREPVVIAPEIEARPPVAYQWYRDGVPIEDETLPWLEWLPDISEDRFAKFTLIAATADGFAISPDFQFNFVPDPLAFRALRAETLGNPAGFNVTFSRPVQPETATNAANYQVDNGVTVLGASLQYGTNTQVIVVHTTPLAPDITHRVRFNGVQSAVRTDLPFGSKLIIQRGDGGIGARTDIPANPTPPLPCVGCAPTATTNFIVQFETPDISDGNRSVNVRGYLTPHESGDYLFHLSAGATTFLYLSIDESPARMQLIALEPEWNGWREWTTPAQRTRNSTSPGSWITVAFPEVGPEDPVNQSEWTVGAIHLEAGRRYYIEADMPQGGGFDQLAVLMRKATDPLPATGAPPIPGDQLAWLESDFKRAPVAITQQPANTNVVQGRRVEFAAKAAGSPFLRPEWLRNGLPVADANELTLVIPEAPLRDHLVNYSVRVRNAFSEAGSGEATLRVTRDWTGPRLTRARGSQRGNDIVLTFDEPIRADLALGLWRYTVVDANDGTPLEVVGAELLGDELNQRFSEVRLTTTPQTPGRRYNVSCSHLYDLQGNVNSGSTAQFTAWVLTPGFVLYERYDNLVGGNLQYWNLPGKLPGAPSYIEYRNSWEAPENVGDQFFARVSGLFHPATSGRHEFFMNSNDSGELWISTDSTPVNLVRIAHQPTWGDRRNWVSRTTDSNNTVGKPFFPVLDMTAGEYRYMELLHMEGGGGDYADATYSRPGDPLPVNGSPSTLVGPVIAAWADPEGAGVELLSQYYEGVALEGRPTGIAFSARGWTGLTNNSILAYQWRRNGTNIYLGNQAALRLRKVSLADDGARFQCEFWAPGSASLTTADILLRVQPDLTPPRLIVTELVSVIPDESVLLLRLSFDEWLEEESATDPRNYRVFIRGTDQELVIQEVSLGVGALTVYLRVAMILPPFQAVPPLDVHLRNLRDISVARNMVTPGDAFVPRLQLDLAPTPPRLRWNLYGDNRILQSAGRLGTSVVWTNEPGALNYPVHSEFALPLSGPNKFYRLKLGL